MKSGKMVVNCKAQAWQADRKMNNNLSPLDFSRPRQAPMPFYAWHWWCNSEGKATIYYNNFWEYLAVKGKRAVDVRHDFRLERSRTCAGKMRAIYSIESNDMKSPKEAARYVLHALKLSSGWSVKPSRCNPLDANYSPATKAVNIPVEQRLSVKNTDFGRAIVTYELSTGFTRNVFDIIDKMAEVLSNPATSTLAQEAVRSAMKEYRAADKEHTRQWWAIQELPWDKRGAALSGMVKVAGIAAF